jgi:hypothetical protein
MGAGEYGGNGSVHWYATHRKDRNHGKAAHSYHEVDEYPTAGGDFTIEVFDIGPADYRYDPVARRLTAQVPIQHHPTNYTEQVRVSWPDPPAARVNRTPARSKTQAARIRGRR